MKYILTLTLFLFTYCSALAQGKIMLVGGGTELDESWSWSNMPYQWAVDQSVNKRVAIIAFGESSDPQWLPDYFKKLGAIAAKNFIINTPDSANSQLTYDTLMRYDVLFFKGGDQSNYYSTYKDSKVTDAITAKYTEGGVIAGTSAGMAIISEIVYTAESGTLYPDQALESINHENITLRNDFVNILNGYVVDTHFIERGRHSRLAAFIGNWFLSQNEHITGIGVDDRTAFCIDENNIGTAYGTGAVTFLSTNDFKQQEGKPFADSINMVALLHNQQYDLSTNTLLNELTSDVTPDIEEESGKYTLYLSGSNELNTNVNLLTDALLANDSVVIVSNNQSSLVNNYLEYLESEGIHPFPIYVAESSDSCATASDRNIIKLIDNYIFLENNLSTFNSFLSETATGRVLNQHIRQDEAINIFIGEDTKMAGKYFVTNNKEDELNAYYGELDFTEGTGLLVTTAIIPDAYDPTTSDFYENNTASALLMPGQLNLKYAALVNQGSYIKYYSINDSTRIDAFGDYSSVLISNSATSGGFADQQVNSAGDVRQVAGYDQLTISLIYNSPTFLGHSTSSNIDQNTQLELVAPSALDATYSGDIVLSWTDNSQNESGFIVERKVLGEDFSLIAQLPANNEQYTDTETEVGNTYEYRVQAVSDNIVSCFSNSASVDVVTSLSNFIEENMRIYPNPVTNGQISIKCNFEGYAEIYNQFGQRLIQQDVNKGITTINTLKLPSGLLYLRVVNSLKRHEEKYYSILNTK